jgi:UDP-glucose 4-epimerase
MNSASKAGHRVLVTGGAGFIGSHLVDVLVGQGYEVCVVDDLSTGRIENVAHLLGHPNFQLVRASITDEAVFDRLVCEGQVVVHLAAAVGVQLIVKHPVRTIETNVQGTECVLRAARRFNARTLIASSSEVYGKGSRFPFSEDDDLLLGSTSKNRWAYAASKMVDEFLALAYHHEQGLPVVCMRLFNTIGPRQSGTYGMVVPRFMRSALNGEPISVYGDGTQTRCFCDVADVVRAIVALMHAPKVSGQVFNIGSVEEIAVRELAERVIRVADSSSKIRYLDYAEAYAPGFEDLQRRVPDISKLAREVDWRPELSTHAALVRVRDWMMSSSGSM